MNIAIIGFGAMGASIKEVAVARGHNVSVVVDPVSALASHHDIDAVDFSGVDVAIDFSSPAAVLKNVATLTDNKVSVVIGTTGWQNDLPSVRQLALKSGIGLLWSVNFSIGVNLYYRVVAEAARLIDQYDEYDIWANELHHCNKADAPSGTAKQLGKILLSNVKRKTAIVEDRLERRIEPHEIHFSSTRGGAVNFCHTVAFDSASDAITICHNARDRRGYALGAAKAAEWLKGKIGVYTMNDFLDIN